MGKQNIVRYEMRIRDNDIDFHDKLTALSEALNISKSAVVKRAAGIGIGVLEKKIVSNETDKSTTEILNELTERINEGFKLLLKNQDGMKFDIALLQSAIYSLVNVKGLELENGNGEINAEDLLEGIFDEPPKWIDELIKTD